MLKVQVKNGKIDRALKVLKNKVRNTKQTKELRDRKEFTKKSEKKRREKQLAIYKQEKFGHEND
jgi:small subunit ribosomal protein S21